jgi:hypothetical protein
VKAHTHTSVNSENIRENTLARRNVKASLATQKKIVNTQVRRKTTTTNKIKLKIKSQGFQHPLASRNKNDFQRR